jgi:hypothetical protein
VWREGLGFGDWVVVDAADNNHVSGVNSNREKNRDFRKIRSNLETTVARIAAVSMTYSQIPCQPEQGIFYY